MQSSRIVITGVGLTSPNGNTLGNFVRICQGGPNIQMIDIRYMGDVPAGVCNFDAKKISIEEELRVGTQVGGICDLCFKRSD